MRLRITKRSVESATASTKDVFIWDTELRGFGLKVTSAGTKVYIVQTRVNSASNPKRITIGRHGAPWAPQQAREEAQRILYDAYLGLSSAAPVKHTEPPCNFEAYSLSFLSEYAERRWRPGTISSAKGNFRKWINPVIGTLQLDHIARSDIVRIFDRVPKDSPALPRNLFALLRRLFSWAVERGDIDKSPMSAMRSPPSPASRERVLTDTELADVWRVSQKIGYPFGNFVRVLMLTGQRRSEVAGMCWQELDRESRTWTLPPARTKNANTHVIPLSTLVLAEIDFAASGAEWPIAGFVFSSDGRSSISSFAKIKNKILLALEIDNKLLSSNWRLHDFRRTFATGMQKLGVRFEVTEALLNHSGLARSGVAGVYQRYSWDVEKREAMERWGSYLSNLIGGSPDKKI